MATRLYFSSLTNATPISPAVDGAWETSTGGVRRMLNVSPDSSGMTSVAVSTTLNSPAGAVDGAALQLISAPLADNGVISAAIKGQIRCLESAAAADMRMQCVIRVLSRDGTVVRGTLIAASAAALSSEFDATTLTNRKIPLGGSTVPTAVTYQAGDRIVVEIGYRKHENATTSRTATFRIGDAAASDLPEDETTTTDSNPWIEFGDALNFQGEVRVVSSSTASVNSTTATLTKPSGTKQDDLLVLAIMPQTNTSLGTITVPSGFSADLTGFYEHYSPDQTGVGGVYVKVAGGSEPSSYAPSWATSTTVSVFLFCFRGADTSDPVMSEGTWRDSASNTQTYTTKPLFFLSLGGFMGISICHQSGNRSALTAPSGFTSSIVPAPTGQCQGFAYKMFSSPQQGMSPGTWSSTGGLNTAGGGMTWNLALRPAGSFPMALRSSGLLTKSHTPGSSFGANKPPNYQVGDLLVAVVTAYRGSTSIANSSGPSGWSQAGSTQKYENFVDTSTKSILIAIYYKTAAGGDSFTFTFSANVDAISIATEAYSGNPAPAIVAEAFDKDTTRDTTLTGVAVTVEQFVDPVFRMSSVNGSSSGGLTPPSGFDWLERTNQTGDLSVQGHGIDYLTTANPGAVSWTSTVACMDVCTQYIIAARQEGVGARQSVVWM